MKRTFYFMVVLTLVVDCPKAQIRLPKRTPAIKLDAGTLAQNTQLKPVTIKQIEALLNEKENRTPAQRKMDSHLIQASKESSNQKMAPGVDLEPANVGADASGYLQVDIYGNITDSLLNKIESLGGKIIYPSKEYHTVRATVNLADVETIAAFSGVTFIQPAVGCKMLGSGNKGGISNKTANIPLSQKQKGWQNDLPQRMANVKKRLEKYMMALGSGTVNSQGDTALRATDARNTFGYAGQGIKIGVLSDSYNTGGTAAAAVASGNLPGVGNPFGDNTAVTVLSDLSNGSNEGQAMLQVVYDIAPKTQLYFATADLGEASFANNIKALRTAGCDIIIDDVYYDDEPVFQDGTIAQAVNTVTANGALYFSAAGNFGSVLLGTSSVYEGDFSPVAGYTFPGSSKSGSVHNFGSVANPLMGDQIIYGYDYEEYTLQWADPWGKSSNDYDLFYIDASGAVHGSSTNIQSGSSNPFESFQSSVKLTSGDRLVVFKTGAAAAVAFHLDAFDNWLNVATNGQTYGHATAADAFGVAAAPAAAPEFPQYPNISYTGPYPSFYSPINRLEYFSSDGPRKIFFNPDGTPITAGNFKFGTHGGTTRLKPDITASDGVNTTLPSNMGLSPFYGTSCAAPHAGAIAALIKSANPSLTTAQIRSIITSNALDIETPGYDSTSGYGIIQAYQAVKAANPTPLASVALGTVTIAVGATSTERKMAIQLTNPSMVLATDITASISTNTSGVTITQNTASFVNVGTGGVSVDNASAPFTFTYSSAVTSTTPITFFIKVNFSGGAGPKGFVFNTTVSNLTVTSNADAGTGSLRATLASAPVGSTIVFGASISHITLTSGELPITNALNIIGPGANALTIDGNNGSRIFNITATGLVNISGLTIANGNVPSAASYGGGGILARGGSFYLKSCLLTNNKATGTLANGLADGGAVYYGGSGYAIIDGCSILNNTTERYGGGIALYGTSPMLVSNCTIYGNSANNTIAGGGGVFTNYRTAVNSCTVFGNSAYLNGGNVYSKNSSSIMWNSIVGQGQVQTTSGTNGYGVSPTNGTDVFGKFTSQGYNLIQYTGGDTIVGIITGNKIGVKPNMLPIGYHGGTMNILLPMSNSPVINNGTPDIGAGYDQRGFQRDVGGQVDMGAVEASYGVFVYGGDNQSANVNAQFADPLVIYVQESGNPIATDTAVFIAPSGTSIASGTFVGGLQTVKVVTDASGFGTSPTFKANNIAGQYNVVGNIGTGFNTLNYHLTNNAVLPITFGRFTASIINCTVNIEWETLTESNSKNFTVERATDGINFTALSTVSAKGNSTVLQSYKYSDGTPAKGIDYYRIKESDLDGRLIYTNTLIVNNPCENAPIVVYPNPVRSTFTVLLPLVAKQEVKVVDASGRMVYRFTSNGGSNMVDVAAWAKGIYSLWVKKDGATNFVVKIVKD